MSSRVTLGTVQFGLDYGVTNQSGIPGDDILNQIFKLAYESGIRKLDTAAAYGNAEERIGQLADSRFHVVTKAHQVKNEYDLMRSVEASLKHLKEEVLYALMFHAADEIIEDPTLWRYAEKIKERGQAEKIGYSLYTIEQLDELLSSNIVPDIVQVPFNILDRRFEERFGILKSHGAEIHVRSVFLQGLLLSSDIRSQKYFNQWSSLWSLLDKWVFQSSVTPLEACLSHVLSYPEIDQVVVGVTNVKELNEILTCINSEPRKAPDELRSNDMKLINPSYWN